MSSSTLDGWGQKSSVTHQRVIDPIGRRITIKEHRPPRGPGLKRGDPSVEEKTLEQLLPEITDYMLLNGEDDDWGAGTITEKLAPEQDSRNP